jgi:phage-related protein
VFAKKTSATPRQVIEVCKQRLAKYDKAAKEQDE